MYQHKEVTFTVPGLPPSKSNGYRMGNGAFFKNPKVGEYERVFALSVAGVKKGIFADDERLSCRIDWYPPNLRSDLDGILKVVFDCCQKNGIFRNDNKIDYIEANRRIVDKKNPRIEVTIWGRIYNGGPVD